MKKRPTKKQKPDRKLKRFKKINFGSGWDKREGYLNVDVDARVEPDLLVADGDYSMIPKNHYEEILANDVLEHISHVSSLAVLLDWAEFLKDKGRLHVQTSSILGVADQLKRQQKFVDQIGWTVCLFGNQAHPGDFHHVGFTEATLKTHLMAAGYKIDSFKLQDKWLFHVDCHKVFDWTELVEKNKNKNDSQFTEAIFKAAFGRKPDDMGKMHIEQGLTDKSLTRKDAIKHLFQSRERLYYIAQKNGL